MSTLLQKLEQKCEQLGKEPKILMKIPGFIIRNYSPDLFDSVEAHLTKYFYEAEPIFSACKVKKDKIDDEILSIDFATNLYKDNLTIIILREDAPGADLKPIPKGTIIEIVGMNRLTLECKYRDNPMDLNKIKGNYRKAMEAVSYCLHQEDIFDLFNVEAFVQGAGLAIHESYTGRGLAKAIINAREPLCKELGIDLTATLFTAAYSQRAATSCGHESFKKILFNEIKNEKGELMFPDFPPDKYVLFMFKRYQ